MYQTQTAPARQPRYKISAAATPARKKKTKRTAVLLSAAALLLIVLLALSPARYAAACLEGVSLWAKAVLPSLFPFFILTALLTKLGAAETLADKLSPLTKKCKLPGAAAYCFLLSILSGYPVGSRIIADLAGSGAVSAKQAARMSVLCSTSGPMFLIGSVGGAMFGSAKAGAILLASHILAVLLVCLALVPLLKPLPEPPPKKYAPSADNILYESVYGAVISILCVGGFIAAFYVLSLALADLHILWLPEQFFGLLFPQEIAEGLCAGLLEATHGCALLASGGGRFALPAAAFCVTFGGACILCQQLGYLKSAGVKAAPFIGIKALQGLAAFLLCFGLCAVFGMA